MSGIIGQQGSRSGMMGYVTGQWKLCNYTSLQSFGNAVFSFTPSNSDMGKGRFLKYRVLLSGIQNNSGAEAELRLTWSCTTGATAGYVAGGYYGGRWAMGASGAFTSASDSDGIDMRICYLNASSSAHGHSQSIIEMDNLGVSTPAGSSSTYNSGICFSTGRVHSTSSSMYGGVTSMVVNNNGPTLSSANHGEFSCISISVSAGTLDEGAVRLYGLVI